MGREGNGVVQGGGAGLFILSGVAQHSKQLTTRKKKLLNNLRGKGRGREREGTGKRGGGIKKKGKN